MCLVPILAKGISELSYHPDGQMVERNNRESDKETKELSTKSVWQGLGLHNTVSSINHHIPQSRVSFLRNRLENEM